MKILMLILSIMTFFVMSKNEVSMDGTLPYDVEVSYSNTYQKGQVRVGDTAKIELTNMGNIILQRIVVYVKSNQSSGAGQWTVKLNSNTIASKYGSLKDWVGAYDNTTYHPIELFSGSISGADQLTIELVGIANSLYIEKFEIAYENAPARTVTLMIGDELYSTIEEEYSGAGVELPTLPNKDEWAFVGWSETHFYEQTSKPNLLPIATYHPAENSTLWAVYTYIPSDVIVSDLTSGTYAYVNTQSQIAITGPVKNGQMTNAPLNLYDENQYYYFEFTPNADTAYIYHLQSDTYIGYSDTKLAAERSPWLVYHDANSTLFYIMYRAKYYVLWPSLEYYPMNGEVICYAGLHEASKMEGAPVSLMDVEPLANGPVYTCHPECGLDIKQVEQTVNKEQPEVEIPLGNYRLKIKNGTKTIELW